MLSIYEIMWKKYSRARQATEHNTIQCKCFAFWTAKYIDTHSEYVILIAFPHQ